MSDLATNQDRSLPEPAQEGTAAQRLTAWFESARPALLRYTVHCLPLRVVAQHDPEDILQDSLLATWKAMDQAGLKDPEAFVRWMRRVLRNRVLDLFKHAILRGESCQAGDDHALHALFAQAPDPAVLDPGERTWRRENVASALNQYHDLAHHQRTCLVLRDVIGMRWRTTSAILGCTAEAAKGTRYRAHKKLGIG